MVENGSLVVLPLTNVAELRQGKFSVKGRRGCPGLAGCMRGMMIVVASMMACSRLVLGVDDRHKYPGYIEAPAEAIPSLIDGDCLIADVADHHRQTSMWETGEG
jgi:hypothetical protein